MAVTSTHDSPSFGDLLRRHRVAAGLTQEALAEHAGLSVRGISDLERGVRTHPQHNTARMLADALRLAGPDRAVLLASSRREPSRPGGRSVSSSAPSSSPPASRLPVFPGSFVGRATEIEAIRSLLVDRSTQLVTLTGPGGTGKTRLAVAIATELRDEFPDGMVFVDLSPLHDPNLVIRRIASSLDAPEVAGEPLTETIVRHLGSRQMLLVLDNCEQVLGAPPDIAALAAACPRLKMLATSREPLRVRAEQVFPVSPLALPESTDLPPADQAAVPAVALFVDRARASEPSFVLTAANAPVIVAICRRLDGLPLAIELAAARVRFLPPPALLVELQHRLPVLTGGARDLPERQRTLRNTIAWSYDLLDPDEQVLFRRLAVCSGGWTLDIAAKVAGFDHRIDILSGMSSLVDQNLVRLVEFGGTEARYVMLETIREFAAERLQEDGDQDRVRQAHLDAMLKLAIENSLDDQGPLFERRLARLAVDEPNLRSAIDWGIRFNPEAALQLTARLGGFWWERSQPAVGLEVHDRVLATGAGADTPDLAIVLYMAAWYALNTGGYTRADTLAETALKLAERLGEAKSAAHARYCQGSIALSRVESQRAIVLLEDALAQFEALGYVWGASACLIDLGIVALDRDDAAAAASYFERCVSIAVEHSGTNTARAIALENLANAKRYLGHLDAALELRTQALEYAEAAGRAYSLAGARGMLSLLALDRGEVGLAASLARESLALRWEIGDPWYLLAALEGAAAVMRAGHQAERATRVLGAAHALRTAIGSPISGCDRGQLERNLAALRSTLGEAQFTRNWAEGERLSPDEAIALSLPALQELASKDC